MNEPAIPIGLAVLADAFGASGEPVDGWPRFDFFTADNERVPT